MQLRRLFIEKPDNLSGFLCYNVLKEKILSVSVLMPVYNTKYDFLSQAIESVLCQTYEDFDLVIINDASTDNAEEVILSYNDKRIKYYKNEQNLKLIATLNKGLDLCEGKYIARLDSDDYCAPQRLEKQVEFMEQHPDTGLSGTLFEMIPDSGFSSSNVADIPLCIRYIPGCLLHSSAMIRKSVLKENNLYYNSGCLHAEDFKMWSDISRVSKVAVLPEVLTYYRQTETGICARNQKFQNKMLMVIAFENMIKDFDCDREKMYSILVKFVKSIPVTEEEFNMAKDLFEFVINSLVPKLSAPYNARVVQYLEAILKHFNIIKEAKIVWMPR